MHIISPIRAQVPRVLLARAGAPHLRQPHPRVHHRLLRLPRLRGSAQRQSRNQSGQLAILHIFWETNNMMLKGLSHEN